MSSVADGSHRPVKGEYCRVLIKGREELCRVLETPRKGDRMCWLRIYRNGEHWDRPVFVSVAQVKVWYDPFDPPVREQTPLELFHDALAHRNRVLVHDPNWTQKPSVRRVLEHIARNGLTFAKVSSK